MASGTIAFEKSNPTGSYLEGKIEWTSVANKDANTSDLTLRIYVRKRATNQQLTVPTTGAWRYEFTVNGQAIEGKSGGNTSVLQTFVLIATKTITVAHNADGTKSVSIVGFVQGPSISDGYKDKKSECDAVAKMDTIPRASQITSASNVTLKNNCNVKWTPASAAFRYRLEFKLGDFVGQTSVIHPNTTAAYTYTGYTIPLSAANQIPKAKTDTMTVTLTTYSDSAGTQAIGSYSKTFTVTVPDNEDTKPSVEAALTPVSNLAGEYQNLYLQGYSKVKADVKAKGKYEATINTKVLSINGVTQKSLTSGYLTSSGENTVAVSVTDSRGITSTVSQTIYVIPYVKPSLKSYGIGRSADGQFKDSGTDLRIDASWDYALVEVGGEQKNSCKLQYQLRAAGVAFDDNWTDIPSEGKSVSVVVENGLVAAENSYHVKIRVIDEIGNTAEATADIPTDKVYWHRDGARGSFAFGGYVEEDNTFAIAPDKKFQAKGSVEFANPLPTSEGGTGKATHTSNAVLTGNGASAVKNVPSASGAFYATAANSAPQFGVLPYAQGGTGYALKDVPKYAIFRNAGDGQYMWYLATGNGALFATAANGAPKFDTLPIAQGGTGATSESAARSNLGTNMKLLWENAAPSSTFAGFTPMTTSTTNKLAENPGNFTAIMVWYRTYKSNEIYVSHIIPVGLGSGTSHDNIKQVTECQAAGNEKWCRRYCFVSSTSITFGTGGYRGAVGNNWTVDSTYMIPVRIYGIR